MLEFEFFWVAILCERRGGVKSLNTELAGGDVDTLGLSIG